MFLISDDCGPWPFVVPSLLLLLVDPVVLELGHVLVVLTGFLLDRGRQAILLQYRFFLFHETSCFALITISTILLGRLGPSRA